MGGGARGAGHEQGQGLRCVCGGWGVRRGGGQATNKVSHQGGVLIPQLSPGALVFDGRCAVLVVHPAWIHDLYSMMPGKTFGPADLAVFANPCLGLGACLVHGRRPDLHRGQQEP